MKDTSGYKICLVIPSLQAGGMERVMSELAWYFSTLKNIELHLILYGISREIFFSIPENINLHKPLFNYNRRRRFFYIIRILFFLRKTVREINPDSILSFGEYWNNLVLLSTLWLHNPIYVSDRGQPGKSLGRFHDALRKSLYKRAGGVILQSEKARDIFIKEIKNANVAVIGNPIREILNAGSRSRREKMVLMVGRLIDSKHQDMLIEMFAKVSSGDWKLLIVGYDHLKQQHLERLKGLARELDIEQRVIFTGKQENIEDIYLNSSIFAFTSSSEGFPNAIGEAMSAGLPVVAFDCIAGPAEMIQDGHNGFLVPLFDREQFCNKLRLLIGDEKLREQLGNNAREDIKDFAVGAIGQKYLTFLLNSAQ